MKRELITIASFALIVLAINTIDVSAYGFWGSSCSDSDGIDFFNQGIVTYGSRTYTDSCYWGSYVKEYYCKYNQVRLTYFRCPDGCSNGACITSEPEPEPEPVCVEDWKCTSWSECSQMGGYKYRTCTDLNDCGTTENKPAISSKCRLYNAWVWENEVINIGDPVSEIGHNLQGWGPIEPDTHGGLWGKSPTGSNCCPGGTINHPVAWDGSTRVISTSTTGDSATIEVKLGWGNFYRSQRIEFMALKGISGDDSFDVYLGGELVYSFADDGERVDDIYCPENWVKHKFTVGSIGIPVRWEGRNLPGYENYAIVELEFVSTAPHWAYYDTYGQVAISEITTNWKHLIKVYK